MCLPHLVLTKKTDIIAVWVPRVGTVGHSCPWDLILNTVHLSKKAITALSTNRRTPEGKNMPAKTDPFAGTTVCRKY